MYSSAALIASTVFVMAAAWLGVVKEYAALFAILLAVSLRLLAILRGWQGPVSRDYSAAIVAHGRRLLSYTPFYTAPAVGPDEAPEADAGKEPLG
jgi:hypothetical protein